MDLVRNIFDSQLFLEARTHSSYCNEHDGIHNERLEWYGDAMLQYIVTRYLYGKYPKAGHSELTRRRAALVCNESLSKALVRCDIPDMRTSRGMVFTTHMLGGYYEAIVGCLVTLKGMEMAEAFVQESLLINEDEGALALDDPVTVVQIAQQKDTKDLPEYTYVDLSNNNGPFECTLSCNWGTFTASASKKKLARKAAATQAMLHLSHIL